jgi:septal ring factor EnvC (AmiA/AmiB activator)
MLASKGNNIVKLSSFVSSHKASIMEKDSLKKDRQSEINRFMQELSWNIDEINKRNSEIEYSLRDSEQHFNNLINQVTQFYK